MMLWTWLLFVVALSTHVYAQVRGVAPKDAHLYEPQNVSGYKEPMFRCLRSGKLIPFINVNDDYCDCEDGTDEPGTSACSNGRFYCENKGHFPRYIRSSRVNDGVCGTYAQSDHNRSRML